MTMVKICNLFIIIHMSIIIELLLGDNAAVDSDSGSDCTPERRRKPSRTRNSSNSKRSPPSKRAQLKHESSSDEFDDPNDEDADDYEEEEEEGDADEDGDQLSPSRKRPSKAKREEEDERIRTVCSMYCTVCSAVCKTFNELMRHYQNEHDMKGFVMCCKRKIATRSRLVEHVECHLNPDAFQ